MSTISPEEMQYYLDHANDNKQPNLIATCVLCMFLPAIAVFLRFFSRWRSQAGFKADDWLILFALVPMAGMTTTTGLAVRYGEGRHIIFIVDPAGFVKTYVAGVVVYSLTVVSIKLSILYLYHRIFPSRGLAILAALIAALVVAYSGALIIFAFLQCIPLSKLWTGEPGICVDTKPAYVTLAAMNVVTDIMILSLPIRFVLRLQMKLARKLQVLGVFALGGIVTVFGIVRCYYVGQASQKDQTWTASEGAIWSQVEISVGIISACLPVYRPLFMRRAQPSYAAHSAKTYTGKPGRGSGSIPLYSKKRGFDLWSTIKSHDEPEDVETGSLVNLRDAGNSQVGKAHIAGQT